MDRPTRAFFLYFLSSYVLVVLISVVAFAVVYVQSQGRVQAETAESVRLQVQRGQDLTEARLDEVQSAVYRVTRTADIVDFMRVAAPLEPRHYYTLLALRSEFEQFNLTSSFVDSVYLLFRESGAVLSTYYTAPDFSHIYPRFVRYEDLDFVGWSVWVQLWAERPALLPARQVQMHVRQLEALTLRVPLPQGAAEPRAVVVALVPVAAVEKHFQTLLDDGAMLTITDHAGATLYTTGADGRGTDGRDRAVAAASRRTGTVAYTARSSRWGVGYTVEMPDSFIAERLFLVRVVFVTTVALTALTGLAMGAFFAFRNSRPLARLFSLLSFDATTDLPAMPVKYQAFATMMERLAGRQIDLGRAVERRDLLLTNGFYERLLRHGFPVAGEVRDYIDNLALSFPADGYQVMVVTVASFGENPSGSAAEVLIHGYLSARVDAGVHLHKTAEGEVLIVPADPQQIVAIQRVFAGLEQAGGVVVVAALGAARRDLRELADSFDEALLALRTTFRDAQGCELVFYRPTGANYGLPDAVRRKLVNVSVTGDTQGLAEALAVLRRENFVDRTPSTPACLALFAELSIVAKQVAEHRGCGGDAATAALERYQSADDFFARLTTALSPVHPVGCQEPTAHRADRVVSAVVDYLNANYADSQLCLTAVSDQFNVNPQYLSRLFHEQTGEAFSAFLERTRMTSARAAIEAGQCSLKEAAAAAGYANWNSFYKAFRRYYGVSPSRVRAAVP